MRQINGAGVGTDTVEVVPDACHLVNRIEKYLGWQPPGVIAGIVLLVVLVMRSRFRGKLIDTAVEKGTDKVFNVELVLDKITGQSIEQLWIGRRIRFTLIIHFVIQTAAKEMAPHAVNQRASEEGIIWPRHPVYQSMAGILLRFE